MKEKISLTIEKKILKEVDEFVDGVRIRNRSQGIEYLIKKALGDEKAAVILCGGSEKDYKLGSNYRFTVSLNGTTLVEEIVKKLRRLGFKYIYIVARENILTEMFRILGNGEKQRVILNFIKEKNSKGSMDSLRLVKGKINKNFLVIFGDVFFEMDLNDLWLNHIHNKAIATLLLESYERPSEKGVVDLEGNKIVTFVQKPRDFKSHIAFASIFICGPEFLEYDGHSLEEDVFPKLAKKGLLFGYITSGWSRHVHTKKDLQELKTKIK